MAIPGGPSRPPAVALPKSERGKFLYERGRRFDASLAATLVLISAGAAWFIGFALLASEFWYLGLLIWAAAVGVFILWR